MNALQESAAPAESTPENMRMNFGPRCTNSETAENGPFSLSFSSGRPTVRKGEDCYTFEGVASSPDEIHTDYYYYYKRDTLGLKEEATWS
jgi:hypothetical protein